MKPLPFAALVGAAVAAPTLALVACPPAIAPALAFATALLYRTIDQQHHDDQLHALHIAAMHRSLTLADQTADALDRALTPDTLHVLSLIKERGPARAALVPTGARYMLPSGQLLTRTRYESAIKTLSAAGLISH